MRSMINKLSSPSILHRDLHKSLEDRIISIVVIFVLIEVRFNRTSHSFYAHKSIIITNYPTIFKTSLINISIMTGKNNVTKNHRGDIPSLPKSWLVYQPSTWKSSPLASSLSYCCVLPKRKV